LLLKRIHNQHGVALIAAMGISLILMVVAIAIAYNVGIFTRATSIVKKKDQLVFSTEFGIEHLRFYLWESWCPPPSWGGVNGGFCGDSDVTGDVSLSSTAYSDMTNALLGMDSSGKIISQGRSYFKKLHRTISMSDVDSYDLYYAQVPNSTLFKGIIDMYEDGENKYTYDYSIYAKQSNNPEILYTMVTAVKRPRAGFEASEARYADRATIEAAIHFSIPCPDDYKQFGQCKSKEGQSRERGITGQIRTQF